MDTFTFTGKLLNHDSEPVANRQVLILPSPAYTLDTAGNTAYIGNTVVTTDAQGAWSVTLITAPDLHYSVRGTGGSSVPPTTFAAPAAGTTLDFADAVPSLPPPAPTWATTVADLQAEIDTKAASSSLATVATSGAYTDLSGKPVIPATPGDIGAATQAQGAKADAAEPAASLDADVTALINDATPSGTRSALNKTFGHGVSVTDPRFGAVADWNGTTGTDNLAAFNAAHDACPPGGTVWVPAGRYYFSDTLGIEKILHLDCGTGGIQQNAVGTELVFAAGKTGIHVRKGASTPSPHGVVIGDFAVTSLSTAAGSDVGILVTDGRAYVGEKQGVAVSSFGSHGIHIQAGSRPGAGNTGSANLSVISHPRVYGNRGDGIRLEGSDTNRVTIIRPDCTANYGYALNFDYVSATHVASPHFDHQYNNSPGIVRDWGNSNCVENAYIENGSSGTAGTVLIDRDNSLGINSEFFRMTVGYYGGAFTLVDNSTIHTHLIASSYDGDYREHSLTGESKQHRFRADVGMTNDAAWSLTYMPQNGSPYPGKTLLEYYAPYDQWFMGAAAMVPLTPSGDLGASGEEWRDVRLSRYLKIGTIYLRDNAGVLEKSTDGTTWVAV